MNILEMLFQAFYLGISATLIMDIGLFILKRFNIPTLNFALLGRWVGWILQGKIIHTSIAHSPALKNEYRLGWIVHYSVGIVFAFSFIVIMGKSWLLQPTFYPALGFGVITVLIPFFIMQPAMGAGFVSAKTPRPVLNCIKSLFNHSIFGCGLYCAAQLLYIFSY